MRVDSFLLLSFLPALSGAANSRPKNAILLSQVQSLTLKGNGAKSAHRRVSAIPQLKCVSPKAICDLYSIDTMRCTNQGSSYGDEDIEWSCVASLPEELKLGSTEVICEGYASSSDDYILKGSCGVEYRMQLTKVGEKRYPDIANPTRRLFSDGEGGSDTSAWLFSVIFIAIVAWMLYSACYPTTDDARQQRRRGPGAGGRGNGGGGGGGGWGGGGWGPGNDPPPPYPGSKPTTQQQGWAPGFWSGLLGGSAMGYYAGNRNNRSNQTGRNTNSGWGGGSGWGSDSAGPSSSSRQTSSSSNTHESTGFGSTRRR